MQLYRWGRAALRSAWMRTATVNLIVTRRCDLACSYCQAVVKRPELPAATWLEIARRLSSRYAAFTISGGEPLLYRELPQLIHGLSRVGLTALCSNVRTITADRLESLDGLDYLNFSIDQTGDGGAGEASRKTAFGKMPLLVEYARKKRFALYGNAVITRRTLDGIPDVVRETTRHGIPLNLQLVLHPGSDDAFATPSDLARLGELQRELAAMKRSGYLIDESDGYIEGFSAFVRGETAVACHAGRTYLAVDSDGRLMPCQDTPAVGMPLHQIDDVDAALDALPGAVPADCRCWWNCFYRYEQWQRAPWQYLARETLRTVRRQR